MPQTKAEEIISLLSDSTDEIRDAVFAELRRTRHVHPIEKQWGTTAEFILEAIARSQDITKRGVRGVIAELAFSEYVLKPIRPRWKEHKLSGDLPYDSLIEDENGAITIQTKNQRLVKGEPLYANANMVKRSPDVQGWFVAETQKTRSGKSKKGSNTTNDGDTIIGNGEQQSTRPYRYGEFDILSVCLHPSTGDWNRFMYTPARTLIASAKDEKLINTFQPVPANPCFAWTDELETCINWVRNPASCPARQTNLAIQLERRKKVRQTGTKAKKARRK